MFSVDDLLAPPQRRPTATVSAADAEGANGSACQESSMQEALAAPVHIPFGLPHRDSAGWHWNADEEEIPVNMETTLTSSMEERSAAFFESRHITCKNSSSSTQNTR